jgi:hypothetical protein
VVVRMQILLVSGSEPGLQGADANQPAPHRTRHKHKQQEHVQHAVSSSECPAATPPPPHHQLVSCHIDCPGGGSKGSASALCACFLADAPPPR